MSSPMISSTFLMNDIPRDTTPEALLRCLAEHWQSPGSQLHYGLILTTLEHEIVLRNSRLDDDLSVTIIQFKDTPRWFRDLDRDRYGFPKKTDLGTLWRGVNMIARDDNNQNEFIRAVIADDLNYAETLAEFPETDVNAQDNKGWSALHWACANGLSEMVSFCLSVPGIDSGLRDSNGLTAFDLSCNVGLENETIPSLFYESMFEMEKVDPDNALLRLLTVTSQPDEHEVFPGEALFGPAERNNLPLAEALMKAGVDLTATNEDQETALHIAAKEGHAKMVHMLLINSSRDAVFDKNAVSKNGYTALHHAAHHGHEGVVEVLLGQGVDTETSDNDGRTARDQAMTNGHTAIQAILDLTPDEQATESNAMLLLAAREGDLARVKFMLAHGADIEAKTTDGATAVYIAAQNGHTETVQLLLAQGADIEAKSTKGATAVFIAAYNGHTETVQLLLAQGADIETKATSGATAVVIAAQCGHTETVQLLLAQGADIDAKATSGATAVYIAAQNGHTETVQLLLAQGASIEAKSTDGATALVMAALNGHTETVQLLLAQGADIEAKAASVAMAVYIAAQNGHTETVQLLLAQGADIEAKITSGATAVYIAAQNGHTETVQLLLTQGADIEAKTTKGATAVYIAAQNGHTETVQLLLAQGADIEAKATSGATAVYIAAQNGHTETVQLLLAQGANIEAKTTEGATAVFIAAQNGNAEIAQLLHNREADGKANSEHRIALLEPVIDLGVRKRLRTPKIFSKLFRS